MDFSTLQSKVADQYNAQAFTFNFDPAAYDSAAINDLLSNVVSEQIWALTGVSSAPQVDSQHQTITVAGTCGSFFKQTNATLTMVFFLDTSGTAQVLIKLDLTANWTFATAFPLLQGTVFDEIGIKSGTVPKYAFVSASFTDSTLENGAFVTGMNFYGEVAPSDNSMVFGYVTSVLGQFVSTTAVGPMSLFFDVPNMTLALGFQSTLEKYFLILKNHVEIQLVCQLDETTNKVGLLLGTKFDFGSNKGLDIYTLLMPSPIGVLSFAGEFTNVALPTPTEFAQEFISLIGGNDLYSSLPDQYQNSSHLFLKRITVGIGVTTLEPVLVSLEIGMPDNDPGWQLGDLATVSQVSFFASVQSPFDSNNRSLFLSVGGQVSFPTAGDPIDLVVNGSAMFSANSPTVYEVRAGLAPATTLTIPVGNLVNKYLPAAVNLPDITLGQLGVDFKFQSPKNHYGIYAGLDKDHPLRFQFGGATVFEVLYGSFHIENDSNNGRPGGGLIGGIKIFSFETDFIYQTPGDFKITALIPQFDIDVAEIANGMLDTSWSLPEWMPKITFPQTSLFIQRRGSDQTASYTFALLAKPSFGAIVLQVLKQDTGWAFAAGLRLDAPKIAAFESLNILQGMDVLFKVNELVFVFTSANMSGGFQFPLTTDFQGGSGKNIQIPSWSGQVKAGFYFYGSMQLNIRQQKNLALVPMMFNVNANLVFQLFVFVGLNPEQDAFAQAGFQGKINDRITFSGYIGARMESGEPQFYLEGILSANIQGSDKNQELVSCDEPDPNNCLTAAVVFVLTENAAFLSASMIGSLTFYPITLSNLVIIIGIDFEGIPSLGFAAQIDLSAFDTTFDSSIAFFIDSGNPGKSMFAGSISDVTLRQIADTIVGTVTGGDQPPAWLDDLLEQVGVSGTGTFYLPSVAASALNGRNFAAISAAFNQATQSSRFSFSRLTTLLIVGESALNKSGVWYITDFPASNVITHYELKTQQNGTIAVSLEPQFYYCMPPGGGSVTLGPPSAGLIFNSGIFLAGKLDFFMLHLAAQLNIIPNKGFAVDVQLVEPVIIIPDYLQLTGNQDTTRGPHFSMSTYTTQDTDPITHQVVTRPAHFYLDGKADLLGLVVATTINVSKEGLLLDFSASIGNESLGANFAVKTSLNSATGFSFEISAGVHINNPHFELFSVDLGTLDLNLNIDTSLTFGANKDDVFLRLRESHFDFAGVSFTIPGFDLNVKTQKLTDLPGIIYDEVKNLIWDFLRDAEHWLELIGMGLIKGFKDIEQVLEEIYNAISSVWGNEKRIVVAVSESFEDSQSTNIIITPSEPGGGVTQMMIDAAHLWAEQTAEVLVTQAIVNQIKRTPPEDIRDFQVSVVQNIDETFSLHENVNWFAVSQGRLPTLATLGFENPFADQRFYTRTTTQRRFQVDVRVDADFSSTVERVTVSVRYNGVNVGSPFIFTSIVPHQFSANWVVSAEDNFQAQHTVVYLNPQIPPISSGWMNQKGDSLIIPLAEPHQ